MTQSDKSNILKKWSKADVLIAFFSSHIAQSCQEQYQHQEPEIESWLVEQKLAPFAYYHFLKTWPSLANRLHPYYLDSIGQNLLLKAQLQHLQQLCRETKVDVILLKGAALNEQVYPIQGLRNMGDIDLLVKMIDMKQLHQLISATDKYKYHPKSHLRHQRKSYESDEYQFEPLKAGYRLLELHGRAFPGWWLKYAADLGEDLLWQRSTPIKTLSPFKTLSPEDQIIHLAVHTAINHQFSLSLLHSLVDMALVIRKYDVKWDLIISQAKSWQLGTIVWITTHLIQQLFSLDLPSKKINQSLRPSLIQRTSLLSILSSDRVVEGYDFRLNYYRYLLLLLLADRPKHILRLIYHIIFFAK